MATSAQIEQRVEDLRAKVAMLREKTMQSQIALLSQENGQLKKDIDKLKVKYENALLSNGKSVSLLSNAVKSSVSAGGEVNKSEDIAKKVVDSAKDSAPTETSGDQANTNSPKKAKKKPPKASSQPKEEKPPAAYDVSKLDLRIGYIREVARHPDADSLYVEQIECGDEPGNEGGFGEVRTVCSGLVAHMKEEDLLNRLVVVMCNLKPAKMRGVTSQGMVMCATEPGKAELIDPPPGAKAGDRVICKEYPGEPEQPFMNPKKKIWEAVKVDLKVDDHGVVRFKDAPLEVNGKGLLTSKSSRNCPVT